VTVAATGATTMFLFRGRTRRALLSLGLALGLGIGLSAHAQATQKVRLTTSMGDIVLELDKAKAPKSVDNFVQYVKAGHYDGTIFHRVIDGFMVQGGGMKADMSEKPTRAPIPLEAGNGLSNVRGAVAMARTGNPNSATSQFFINVVDNLRLDSYGGGYAVFGKVTEGMDVVDKIRAVETKNAGMHQNVPVQPVLIKKASLE
jgi:peptidyl-prolyl cis-trans isomerase A (cyclophilin A)